MRATGIMARGRGQSLFYNFKILKIFDQIPMPCCYNVLFLHKILNKVPESICETFAIMLHSHNTISITKS